MHNSVCALSKTTHFTYLIIFRKINKGHMHSFLFSTIVQQGRENKKDSMIVGNFFSLKIFFTDFQNSNWLKLLICSKDDKHKNLPYLGIQKTSFFTYDYRKSLREGRSEKKKELLQQLYSKSSFRRLGWVLHKRKQ